MIAEFFIMLGGAAYFAGKCLNESGRKGATQRWINSQNFNQKRQHELELMAYDKDPEKRRELNRLVKRTVGKRKDIPFGDDVKLAVRQISQNEGWRFYYILELHSYPAFVKMEGGKWDKSRSIGMYDGYHTFGAHIALMMNRETKEREAWIGRCPHGDEVEIYPMDYETEEEYQAAVEKEYHKVL